MSDKPQERVLVIQIILAATTLLLIGKAFMIQVADSTYRDKAEATAIDKHVIYPSRGLIYDRNGKLLVTNSPVYDLMVTYNRIDPKMDTTKFCSLLNISKEEFIKSLSKNWRSARYSKRVPFVFRSKIPSEIYAKFREVLFEFPGFYTQLRNNRSYPQPYAAHLLGYIREVDQATVKKQSSIYKAGDYIGASGLEEQYENLLRGKKGVEYLLKDNLGRTVGAYLNGTKDSNAISGVDLHTSIDLEVQGYAEQLMINKKGAIVAIDPSNGEVLVFVSAPSYDPGLLAIGRERGNNFKVLLKDSLQPFFNRATKAQYPPGSIFKTAIALTALQNGFISPHTSYSCGGGYYVGSRRYGCHFHPFAKNVSVALAHSCNTFFWHNYRHMVDDYGRADKYVGLKKLNKSLSALKFGQKTGIDFPNESSGNIPSTSYYDKIYPQKLGSWKSAMTMSTAIGQGEIQMTTLQMASLAATIGAKGNYRRPHIVRELKQNNTPIDTVINTNGEQLNFNKAYFDLIIDGMAGAINYGTAPRAKIPNIEFCGKTGTSQNAHGEDHSVFFGFAPKENPKIAIAVFVENAGFGGTWAAPIASLIVEKYLTRSIAPSKKYEEQRIIEANLIKD